MWDSKALDMRGLAALPLEVSPKPVCSALDLTGMQSSVPVAGGHQASVKSLLAVKTFRTVLCAHNTLLVPARQLLENVVAKLPPCEAIQLHLVSQ